MRLLAILALALPLMAQTEHAFQLEPGEWRWVDFTVRQTPTEVNCSFRVLQGNASVHVELLPRSEFNLFSRGRKHDTLAVTPDSRGSAFRRIVDDSGRYAVVIVNAKNAPAATVTLDLSTNANPNAAGISRELSPRRRMTVVLVSLFLFFVTATWSAWKLTGAMRRS